MKRVSFALIAVALLIISGCSKPEDALVGSYRGSVVVPEESKERLRNLAQTLGEDPEELIDVIENMSMTLILKDEGTFTLNTITDEIENSVNGKWTLSEDGETLSIHDYDVTQEERQAATESGFPIEGRQEFSVSEGGEKLTYTNTSMGITATTLFERN